MAQYAVLIYVHDSAHELDATPEDIEDCDRHSDELVHADSMVAAYALTPREMATSIRRDGITDGPFVDAKEVVAGLYVIEAPDLDSAIAIARLNPDALRRHRPPPGDGVMDPALIEAIVAFGTDHGRSYHPGEEEDRWCADPLSDPAAELPERLQAVLEVIHLVFATGHTAPSRESLVRADLVDQALRLSRTLNGLMPDVTEVHGLYALLLVTDARRRATRVDAEGRLLRLQDQDRTQWDRVALAEAEQLILDCLDRAPPSFCPRLPHRPPPRGWRR